MDRNLPASAGDMGSILGLGKFHMPWHNWTLVPQLQNPAQSSVGKPQLMSPCAASTAARVHRACAVQQEKQDNEKPAHRN